MYNQGVQRMQFYFIAFFKLHRHHHCECECNVWFLDDVRISNLFKVALA